MQQVRWCHLRCFDENWDEIKELMEEDLTLDEAQDRLRDVVARRLGKRFFDDESGPDGRLIVSVDLEVPLG